jgi:hypothetical protein
METFTLLFFVLMLLAAALIVTQTIRRDLKERERAESEIRRETKHVRRDATHRAFPSQSLQPHAHKSHQRPL